jgi:hypothetical protein
MEKQSKEADPYTHTPTLAPAPQWWSGGVSSERQALRAGWSVVHQALELKF